MMTLQEYEMARGVLEEKLREVGERERKHKEKAHVEFQIECKRIAAQMGSLKHKRAVLNKKYQQDKAYIHGMYRKEKQDLNLQMHTLKMEYLTVNGIDDRKNKITPPHRHGVRRAA